MENKNTYIALLRGINVSGQKLIKIEELQKLFEALKFESVRTYIQSGNVIFKSDIKEPAKIIGLIEKKIKDKFSFDVTVIIRNTDELGKIIKNNPFVKTKPIDKLYTAFLSGTFDKSKSELLEKYKSKTEEYKINNTEVYLYYPDGAGRTKLTNNIIESKLGVKATSRNWNTVNKLYELSLNT